MSDERRLIARSTDSSRRAHYTLEEGSSLSVISAAASFEIEPEPDRLGSVARPR